MNSTHGPNVFLRGKRIKHHETNRYLPNLKRKGSLDLGRFLQRNTFIPI